MSVLGKDFEDAMKQLKATLADAQTALITIDTVVAQANAVLVRLTLALDKILKP